MDLIERFFVRAKHWQVFLLFASLFVLGTLPFAGDFSSTLKSQEGSAAVLFAAEAAGALFTWCFLLWLWQLGSFLNSVVSPTLRRKKSFFLFTIMYVALYVIASFALFQSIQPKLLVVTGPLRWLGIYCMLCSVYFVAEGLVTAEVDKRPSFLDCLGPFLLLWFFPVGVWFIQPRVSRLYAKAQSAELSAGAAGD